MLHNSVSKDPFEISLFRQVPAQVLHQLLAAVFRTNLRFPLGQLIPLLPRDGFGVESNLSTQTYADLSRGELGTNAGRCLLLYKDPRDFFTKLLPRRRFFV